jgi:hypothetical protein
MLENDETTVTVTSSSSTEPSMSPPAAPQVVALETAGVTDLAREQGAQSVTLEMLSAQLLAQAGELQTHRAELAELRARQQQTVEVVAAIEEPETIEEAEALEEVQVIDVAENATTKPSGHDEAASTASLPRRERGPLLRMFLGRSI